MLEGLLDLNNNGIPDILEAQPTDGQDIVAQCPYQPGSTKAKLWWKDIEAQAKERGEYMGGPLRPGVHPGDKDFHLLRDKLRITSGLDVEHATNIVAKLKGKLYG